MSGFLSGRSGGGMLGGVPNGVKMAAVAFLIQQLMKHGRGNDGTVPASNATTGSGGGGGLGDILGGLLGGGGMAGGAGGLGGMLGGGGLGGLLGGLSGMLGGMRSQGLGQQVDSWVAPGANQQVSPQDLERHFDPQDLDEAAQHAGTDRAGILDELSRVLPQFVDQATPHGRVPQQEQELGGGNNLGSIMDGILRGNQGRG
jgi:uncharacterized protein YidB (DUF937 family)